MLINFIDILMAAIILRFVIKGVKGVFIDELFSLIFVFLSAIITAHYFERFSLVLGRYMYVDPDKQEFVAYYLLAICVCLIYPLIRDGWVALLKIEFNVEVNQWIRAVVSGLKAYLIAGIIFLGLIVTQIPVVVNQANHSISNILFRDLIGGIYFRAYYGPIKWMSPDELRNKRIFELIEDQKDLKEKKKKSKKKSKRILSH